MNFSVQPGVEVSSSSTKFWTLSVFVC